jgi:RHS Repeat
MRTISLFNRWTYPFLSLALLAFFAGHVHAQTATFTYDQLNRLTSATYGTDRVNYLYDSAGNITHVVTPAGCTNAYYRDADSDGFGDPDNSILSCSLPEGFVIDNTDCNDDPATGLYEHPGQTWYPDLDGDGYYAGPVDTSSCARPANHYAAEELVTVAVQDNSPAVANPDQLDSDNDLVGDASDAFPQNAAYSQDVDGDGIADEWETVAFGSLTVAGATTDADNDGLTDAQEFVIDSDPNVGICDQWDANGDGKIGVEEAIRALQITSGSE